MKIRERLGGIRRDVMRSIYTAVVAFAAISIFSFQAQAQGGAGNDNLQSNASPNAAPQQSLRPRVVVTDPVGDGIRRRQRVTTLSMDTDRPSGNTPGVGTANSGVLKSTAKRNRGLRFVDGIVYRMMSRQRRTGAGVR